jgi:hypothetical protein
MPTPFLFLKKLFSQKELYFRSMVVVCVAIDGMVFLYTIVCVL